MFQQNGALSGSKAQLSYTDEYSLLCNGMSFIASFKALILSPILLPNANTTIALLLG
ncbi:hypothetical protein EPHNCH_0433 [Anaplasma phagocytophilum str. NCH-1]|uniref:Uncharacterized protein n=1 Tax=Anaplasma phagocytophilum str. NCH-1 TaxID=1359161 RepID=A0A0F3NK85_ANAPH|nr:hypothetical protein EPHNCH_0433 [Anaplasma phagocytophilum str. NCH-1]